ncbi:MAG TPA: DUF4139 domain-containing protein [Burkholderiaceae bacterium]|nr:DUF4139 domain-containing protein [Burkholderiaceae bacterium]
MRMYKRALGLMFFVGSVHCAEPVKDIDSSQADRQGLSLTVYSDDLALVRERRQVQLPAGRARLVLRDVAAHLRPETVLMHAAGGPAIALVEQQFDYDLLTPQKLLEKNVGREVTVLRSIPTTGEDRHERATVVSAGEGPILRFADRVEAGVPGRIGYDGIPPGLHDRPTLSVLLEAAGDKQSVEFSYLTSGMSWKADYVASLAPDGKSLELTGWASLTNRSGVAFDGASLRLVAGNVHRVRSPVPLREQALASVAAARAAPMEPAEEELADFHLYSFEHPVSIAENQTKLLSLLSAHQIPVRREYVLTGSDWLFRDRVRPGSQKQRPALWLSFDNKGGELGRPLPGGVVRVYAHDASGAPQFVGEDRMDHIPKNETVKLNLGEAFDITTERTQSAFRRIAKNVVESSWHIELHNAKDESVTVKVLEAMPDDWEIVQESQPHTKDSAHRAQWQVQIPAGGGATLEYVVRVTS